MARLRSALFTTDSSPRGAVTGRHGTAQRPTKLPWYVVAQFAPSSAMPSPVEKKVGFSKRTRLKITQGARTTAVAHNTNAEHLSRAFIVSERERHAAGSARSGTRRRSSALVSVASAH